MHPIRVDVAWTPESAGGRSSPPDGPNYATVVRFDDEPLSEAFSVMMQRVDQVGMNGSGHWIADLRLLFPENFEDKLARLQPGSTLVIHEGRRVVGRCEILAQTVEAGA
jgi:hypothetical protein